MKFSFKFTEFGFMASVILIVILVAMLVGAVKIYDQRKHFTEQCVLIQDLQQQQKISGSGNSISTEIRFVVITDAGTFTCRNSLLNWKFNNSDLFYRLEKGKKYNLNLAGIGKGIVTDYPNILSFSDCR